ncbi:hypothetical protein [Halorussus halobius]|uniref:hypothetical protein n=1 Tax=Halorussus halobius TaxID=1710537 RepID=UPI0010930409|nr:hypothetical protein [Halorussus halobius]
MNRLTRRRLCAALPATAALAGCLGGGGRRHLLAATSGTIDDRFLVDPTRSARHVARHADELLDDLFADGRLVTLDASLDGGLRHPETPAGVRRRRPTYVEREGTYYRLRVTDAESTDVEAWVVWFEPVEDASGVDPVDADTFSSDRYGALDANVLSAARRMAMNSVAADEDHAETPLRDRGVVFFDPLDPADSDVVPDPPFEYGRVTDGRPGLPDEQLLRLHVERARIPTTRYVHEIERVTDDPAAFRERVETTHLDATFDRDELDEGVREILDGLGEAPYEEDGNASKSLATLLERLDLSSVEVADGETRARRERYYAYDGSYYDATYTLVVE